MMNKQTKLVVTVVFTVIGIGLAVFLFDPRELPFWAEISKAAPAILVSLLAMWVAHDSREEARASKDEAQAARGEMSSAREEVQAVRDDAKAAKDEARRSREAAEGRRD